MKLITKLTANKLINLIIGVLYFENGRPAPGKEWDSNTPQEVAEALNLFELAGPEMATITDAPEEPNYLDIEPWLNEGAHEYEVQVAAMVPIYREFTVRADSPEEACKKLVDENAESPFDQAIGWQHSTDNLPFARDWQEAENLTASVMQIDGEPV